MRFQLNGQNEIVQDIVRWDDPKLLEMAGPSVELVASFAIDPTIPDGPQKHLVATTLTIRMDAKVAIRLSEQIRDLARTKGWPLLG